MPNRQCRSYIFSSLQFPTLSRSLSYSPFNIFLFFSKFTLLHNFIVYINSQTNSKRYKICALHTKDTKLNSQCIKIVEILPGWVRLTLDFSEQAGVLMWIIQNINRELVSWSCIVLHSWMLATNYFPAIHPSDAKCVCIWHRQWNVRSSCENKKSQSVLTVIKRMNLVVTHYFDLLLLLLLLRRWSCYKRVRLDMMASKEFLVPNIYYWYYNIVHSI